MATPDELRALEADWDSYGGLPIDERCIKKAIDIASLGGWNLDLTPMCDGGVAVEGITEDGCEIEFAVSPQSSEGSSHD